jgi:hypothetical protein
MDERTVARFWAKVDRRGPDECWPWTGATMHGYGVQRVLATKKTTGAHRIAWEVANGPIPTGLDIDHQCHNVDLLCKGGMTCAHRRCVNPAHLEPATRQQNMHRSPRKGSKTHCTEGHLYDAENTYVTTLGHRQCRTCNRRRDAIRAPRRRLARQAA